MGEQLRKFGLVEIRRLGKVRELAEGVNRELFRQRERQLRAALGVGAGVVRLEGDAVTSAESLQVVFVVFSVNIRPLCQL